MAQETEQQPARRKLQETVGGALLGISVVVVIQFVGLPQLDRALTASLYCFAVCITSLTYFLMHVLLDTGSGEAVSDRPFNKILFTIGLAAALGGVASMFLHFSYKAVIVFGALCLVVIFGELIYEKVTHD